MSSETKLISLNQAAEQGIEYLRRPIWADPLDHLKIDIVGGALGVWARLFCPFNLKCNGRDPVQLMTIEMTGALSVSPTAEVWEPYTGPRAGSEEYKAAQARFEKFNDR